jgi:hypothetical protein
MNDEVTSIAFKIQRGVSGTKKGEKVLFLFLALSIPLSE